MTGQLKQPIWLEWRCVNCNIFLAEYNAAEPCHIRRWCKKCNAPCELDRREISRTCAIIR